MTVSVLANSSLSGTDSNNSTIFSLTPFSLIPSMVLFCPHENCLVQQLCDYNDFHIFLEILLCMLCQNFKLTQRDMGIYGYGQSLEGNLEGNFQSVLVWSSLVQSGIIWASLVQSSLVKSSQVQSGLVWSSLVLCGLVYTSLVYSGLLWSSQVYYGLV